MAVGVTGRRTGRTPGSAASLSCARRRLAFMVIADHSAPAGNRVAEHVDDGHAVNLQQFFERATQAFEVLGVSSMVLGTGYAIGLAVVTWKRTDGKRAFKTLRTAIGGAILLGLELLVAADI